MFPDFLRMDKRAFRIASVTFTASIPSSGGYRGDTREATSSIRCASSSCSAQRLRGWRTGRSSSSWSSISTGARPRASSSTSRSSLPGAVHGRGSPPPGREVRNTAALAPLCIFCSQLGRELELRTAGRQSVVRDGFLGPVGSRSASRATSMVSAVRDLSDRFGTMGSAQASALEWRSGARRSVRRCGRRTQHVPWRPGRASHQIHAGRMP